MKILLTAGLTDGKKKKKKKEKKSKKKKKKKDKDRSPSPSVKASTQSGTWLSQLPVPDTPTVPKSSAPPSGPNPCSDPCVSSSRSPSRSRKQCPSNSPEEITLLSSDPDSDIVVTSEDENSNLNKLVHAKSSSVGPHIPLTRLSPDTSRPTTSGQGHRDTSQDDAEGRWQSSVRSTSTPRRRILHDTVCSHHRHFGPAPRQRTRGPIECITLLDSD